MVRLGVGKNMVRSIRHWGFVCGVLEESPGPGTTAAVSCGRRRSGARCSRTTGGIPTWRIPRRSGSSTTPWPARSIKRPPGTWRSTISRSPNSRKTSWSTGSKARPRAELGSGFARVPAPRRRGLPTHLRALACVAQGPAGGHARLALRRAGLIREHGKGVPDPARAIRRPCPMPSSHTGSSRSSSAMPRRPTIAFAPGSPGRVFALTEDALDGAPRTHRGRHGRPSSPTPPACGNSWSMGTGCRSYSTCSVRGTGSRRRSVELPTRKRTGSITAPMARASRRSPSRQGRAGEDRPRARGRRPLRADRQEGRRVEARRPRPPGGARRGGQGAGARRPTPGPRRRAAPPGAGRGFQPQRRQPSRLRRGAPPGVRAVRRLSLTERSEWAKVQGRFADLAFQEASHELLRLVGEAIERHPGASPRR